jgi:hypothetical protein
LVTFSEVHVKQKSVIQWCTKQLQDLGVRDWCTMFHKAGDHSLVSIEMQNRQKQLLPPGYVWTSSVNNIYFDDRIVTFQSSEFSNYVLGVVFFLLTKDGVVILYKWNQVITVFLHWMVCVIKIWCSAKTWKTLILLTKFVIVRTSLMGTQLLSGMFLQWFLHQLTTVHLQTLCHQTVTLM